MDNIFSMIHYLIGRARIKYTILDEIFHSVYIPKENHLVFHVDASSILYRLYREKDLDTIENVPYEVAVKDLVVSFINAIGHYRRYFVTRLGMSNSIMIYFNKIQPIYQSMIFGDYRKSWYNLLKGKNAAFTGINQLVEDAMTFIGGLVPYFDGIYMMSSDGVDDYTAMKHVMKSNKYKDCYHLIFSRNLLTTQLIDPNCSVLYNKRDDSYLISNGTVFKNGVLKGRKTGASENLCAQNLPFVWCLGGCSDIDLKPSKFANGIADAVKLINPMADNGFFSGSVSIQSFLKEFSKYTKKGSAAELKLLPENLINRYRILNLDLCEAAMTDAQKINLWKNHIDLYDQTGLEDINNKLADIGASEQLLDISNLNMSEPYWSDRFDSGTTWGSMGEEEYMNGFGGFFNYSI